MKNILIFTFICLSSLSAQALQAEYSCDSWQVKLVIKSDLNAEDKAGPQTEPNLDPIYAEAKFEYSGRFTRPTMNPLNGAITNESLSLVGKLLTYEGKQYFVLNPPENPSQQIVALYETTKGKKAFAAEKSTYDGSSVYYDCLIEQFIP